jgi:hypothetical protein
MAATIRFATPAKKEPKPDWTSCTIACAEVEM